ncbi:EBDP4, emopamil-binding protein [Aspergillus ellipticus CBS 707.79]|uniref:EBDP4, emopamil-binding protein n=1 Tax=Aspergillus ellipticus CBS 707.79 TaxID=1448320 RepID=A0A319DQM2_9EURO|nr:EBDP4, emopamil-binding protein [Aspergillus ellipticus CBS 707.79]
MASTVAHPYYPPGIEITGYVANTYDAWTLIAIFVVGCVIIFSITTVAVLKARPQIPRGDLYTILWFVLCGFVHFLFEGYYTLNYTRMGTLTTVFGQLWKEYSLSDSRYLVPDAFVLSMESITAFCWGPLSFLLAYLITADHQLRYPIQGIVSLGQLYGDVLYYATAGFDESVFGRSYSRPERSYFWGYFVFCNAFWIVAPACEIYSLPPPPTPCGVLSLGTVG